MTIDEPGKQGRVAEIQELRGCGNTLRDFGHAPHGLDAVAANPDCRIVEVGTMANVENPRGPDDDLVVGLRRTLLGRENAG